MLERADAAAYLAALAGPQLCQRCALALAEAPTGWGQDARTGSSRHGGTFGGDWHTGPRAKTPRKSARMACWPHPPASRALPGGQKGSQEGQNHHLSGCGSVVKEHIRQLGIAESICVSLNLSI